MSSNFYSATPLVSQLLGDIDRFGQVLPPEDRIVLRRLAEHALNDRAVIDNASSLRPMEVMLLLLVLEQHDRSEREMDELREVIGGLETELQRPPGYRFRDG